MSDEPSSKPPRPFRPIFRAEKTLHFDQLAADQPLTLKQACDLVFGGSISPASLKAEHNRGNLRISKIGRQYFTSMADINLMIKKCCMPAAPLHSAKSLDVHRNGTDTVAAVAALDIILGRLKAAGKKKPQD